MRGPFPLQPLPLGMHVPTNVRGVFCLARKPDEVLLIGRADKDLRTMLKSYVGKYQIFWFETALTAQECFVTHCRLYHKHEDRELDDHMHPAADKPDQKCPVCGI